MEDFIIIEFSSYHDLIHVKMYGFKPTLLKYLEDYKATVYSLNDGRLLLTPYIGGKALIFNSEEVMLQTLKTNGIPLDQVLLNPFMLEQNNIIIISTKIDFYVEKLCEVLDYEPEVKKDIDYLSQISIKLSKSIKSVGKKEFINKFYMPIGIYTGEIIRSITDVEWKIEKKFDVNPFYIPELFDRDLNSKFNIWPPLMKSIFERQKVDIVANLKQSGIGGSAKAEDYFKNLKLKG